MMENESTPPGQVDAPHVGDDDMLPQLPPSDVENKGKKEVTVNYKGKSKVFAWEQRTRIGALKRKVATAFKIPREQKFFFTGENGERPSKISSGDTLKVSVEKNSRRPGSAGKAPPTPKPGKTPEQKRAAALKTLLSALEV